MKKRAQALHDVSTSCSGRPPTPEPPAVSEQMGKQDRTIQIRATNDRRRHWKAAARRLGMNLSVFLRCSADANARALLDPEVTNSHATDIRRAIVAARDAADPAIRDLRFRAALELVESLRRPTA